jgi:hypothetical protein
MQEKIIVFPPATLHKFSELADLLAQASQLAREISRSSEQARQAIPDDQAWFWSPEWQAGEREVDEQLARGECEAFDSMEDAIAYLHQQV